MFTAWLQEVFDCPLVIQLTGAFSEAPGRDVAPPKSLIPPGRPVR